MEYTPPPLFRQGASARVKATICALLSIALLFADARVHTLTLIRQVVGTVLYPVQRVALLPRDGYRAVSAYFSSVNEIETAIQTLQRRDMARSEELQHAVLVEQENQRLRQLLGARERIPVKSVLAEILYDARDPFTRKVIVDRGLNTGVAVGQPVIDESGIVGQVTRVFPLSAEITLLTDRDQAIPVQVLRNGLRSVAYGRGQSGKLDLRFMPVNSDVKVGDLLITSGIDGIYPGGLSVARVSQIDTRSGDVFAHISCEPVAGIRTHRQLLILLADTQVAARPDDQAPPPDTKTEALAKRQVEQNADNQNAPAPAHLIPKTRKNAPASRAAGTNKDAKDAKAVPPADGKSE